MAKKMNGDAVAPQVEGTEAPAREEPGFRPRSYAETVEDYRRYIRVQVNELPRPVPLVFYSLQHTLGFMAATVLMPIIVGSAIELEPAQIGTWISIVFFVAGIATLMQVLFGNRLPIVQSASAAFVPAMIAVASTFGLPSAAFGMLAVGAIEAVIGFSRLLGLIRRIFTPVVIAPTIALIGLSLFEVAANFVSQGIGLALLVVAVTLLFNQGFGQRLRPFSILIGLLVGTAVAWPFGLVDFSTVAARNWFRLPTFFPWGEFTVQGAVVATLSFGLIASIFESIGDYYTTSIFAGVELEDHHVNRGIGIEGVDVMIAGLFGGLPVTSYTVNSGIIGLTGVASRYVVMGAGVIGIVLGLVPKVGQTFASVPRGAFGGAMIVLFGTIIMGGLKQLERLPINPRNMSIMGTALMAGLVLSHLPEESVAGFPQAITTLLASGMVVGAFTAIALDQLIPGTEHERGLAGENG